MKFRNFACLLLAAFALIGVLPAAAQEATPAACPDGYRLIAHAAGSSCIPQTVKRVAVFDTGATELLLALNYRPVVRSAFLERFQLAVLPDLKDKFTALTGDLPDMGFPINLEVLLESHPDVIITNSDFAPLFPENIETIAPLIVLDREWKGKLIKTAEVIGLTGETEALLAGYERRVDTLKGLLADKNPMTLSLVRAQNEDFIIYLPETFGGSILSEVGIKTPAKQIELGATEAENGYFYPSRERLDLLDGDVIFMFIAYPDPDINAASQKLIDALADDPLFQSLNAPKNKTFHQVDGYWYGDGIFSAHRVLNDLFTMIAKVDPAEVSPDPLVVVPEVTATAEA